MTFIPRSMMILAVSFAAALTAQAEPVSFQIDPVQSTYVLSGMVTDLSGDAFPLLEQSAGSLHVQLAGSLQIDLDQTGTISFVGGQVDSVDYGTFLPFGLPASAAFQAQLGSDTLYWANRNSSGEFTGTANLNADGTFSTSGLAYMMETHELAYEIPGLGDGVFYPFEGLSFPNGSGLIGLLDESGGDLRLFLPFSGSGTIRGETGTLNLQWQGELVAVAVPEPGSFMLAVTGVVAGMLLVRRRHRHPLSA